MSGKRGAILICVKTLKIKRTGVRVLESLYVGSHACTPAPLSLRLHGPHPCPPGIDCQPSNLRAPFWRERHFSSIPTFSPESDCVFVFHRVNYRYGTPNRT